MIDKDFNHRRILYRNASAEAIMRRRDKLLHESLNPKNGNSNNPHPKIEALRLDKLKLRDESLELESQRTDLLDENCKHLVHDYML